MLDAFALTFSVLSSVIVWETPRQLDIEYLEWYS